MARVRQAKLSAPSRVSSRTKLAAALQISRPTLYAYARLEDSPPARDGYWYIAEWRRFITRKRDSLQSTEKESLQAALLRAKLAREQYDLDQLKDRTRNEIKESLLTEFLTAAHVIRDKLHRLRGQLAPVFAGASSREIYRLWGTAERELFANVCAELSRRAGVRVEEPDTRSTDGVVVAFKNRNSNGNTATTRERKVAR